MPRLEPSSDQFPLVSSVAYSRWGDSVSATDQVIAEMAKCWSQGDHRLAEEFLKRYPELTAQPETAVRLIYEEFCLREEHGQDVSPEAILKRFPQWREQLVILLECDRVLKPSLAAPAFPKEGDDWLDFRLVRLLGRGALGAVFLAIQPALNDRPVVLKITPCDGREHLLLARLQHTNIVPLYAAHDEPGRNLRTLCMPYFGGASLAHVLIGMRGIALHQRTGQSILTAVDRIQANQPNLTSSRGPRQTLSQASYIQAVCLMGIGLAEGLQYAHDRGLIHLDIKPANVLITADGQAMLLDFHLAQEPIKPNSLPPAWLGGTPFYMSLEQEAALNALRESRPVRTGIDGRSDVYSLGLLLHETLGGPIPVDGNARSELPRHNPQVSSGLADIIQKCLNSNPAKRYQAASALADDLRRHLFDQPLRGVANRSLTERWGKWRRRRPQAVYVWAAAFTALFFGVLAGGIWWTNNLQNVARLETDFGERLAEGQMQLEQRHFDAAMIHFKRAKEIAQQLPQKPQLVEQTNNKIQLVAQLKLSEDLHGVVERLHCVYAAEHLQSQEMHRLAESCSAFWNERERIQNLMEVNLQEPERGRLRNDLFEMGLMWADLRVLTAQDREKDNARGDALLILDQMERMLKTSPPLLLLRQRLAEALGLREIAEVAFRAYKKSNPPTAWEHLALGRFLLRPGPEQNLEAAADHFHEAVVEQPQNFWANYYQGICAFRLKRFEDALSSLKVCVSLAPDSEDCRSNRDVAQAELDKIKTDLREKLQGNKEGLSLLNMLESKKRQANPSGKK